MTQPVHGVYKIDTSNNIELIIAYIRKPNGIIVSPDPKTLYISTVDNISNGNISKSYKGDKPKLVVNYWRMTYLKMAQPH